MSSSLSSRERMLAAIQSQPVDRAPCAFMLFNGLKSQCGSYLEFIDRQLEMGLDAFVQLPPRPPHVVNDSYNLHGLPVSYPPSVTIREYTRTAPGENDPLLVKEYHTPAGVLTAEVRQTADWRWGQHVPFLDDYITPRSRKFLITHPADLNAFSCLLAAPTAAEINAFRAGSAPILDKARQAGLLVAGGWGVGADLLGWVYGLENMIYTVHDQPDFITELLRIIAAWNRARMAVVLDAGIDLYIKRAWYENTDFWSPRQWKRFIQPILQADVELAHQAGARFGYIITAACMPLLDAIAACGVDVIIGADPRAWDLALAQQTLSGRTCLWGGVNGHLTVEQGEPAQTRAEVQRALALFDGGGLILSPVDNVRAWDSTARENVTALIDEWQRLTR